MNCVDHEVLVDNANELNPRCDDQLVSAAQAGSPMAFAEIHTLYSRRLYNTSFAITKSREDAEDALQETFLRVYLAIRNFEGRSSLYSWLSRIAINSALMVLRKRRTHPEILFDPQPDPAVETICFEVKDSSLNPEQEYDLRQRMAKLLRAIRVLDDPLREPLRLQIGKGSSVKEIGQTLNISEAAVKARLYRARQRLSSVRNRHFSNCRSKASAIGTAGRSNLTALSSKPD